MIIAIIVIVVVVFANEIQLSQAKPTRSSYGAHFNMTPSPDWLPQPQFDRVEPDEESTWECSRDDWNRWKRLHKIEFTNIEANIRKFTNYCNTDPRDRGDRLAHVNMQEMRVSFLFYCPSYPRNMTFIECSSRIPKEVLITFTGDKGVQVKKWKRVHRSELIDASF